MSTTRPMFSLLSVVANQERHKLASGEPWLLLLDLVYPGAANPGATQQHVRLVRNLDPVTFDAGDGNGPQLYTPFNFELGDVTSTTQGSYPESSIKVSNVMRVLQTTIEAYGGVVGANLNLYVVNAANPAGEPELALAFTVLQTTCDVKLVTFKLGACSPLRRLFPLFMYRPNYCIWQYKGLQCGYVDPAPFSATLASGSPLFTPASVTGLAVGMPLAAAGIPANTTILSITGGVVTMSANATASGSKTITIAFTTCAHTIDGSTGCQAHANLLRFGGFPGIDSNGAAAAGVA